MQMEKLTAKQIDELTKALNKRRLGLLDTNLRLTRVPTPNECDVLEQCETIEVQGTHYVISTHPYWTKKVSVRHKAVVLCHSQQLLELQIVDEGNERRYVRGHIVHKHELVT